MFDEYASATLLHCLLLANEMVPSKGKKTKKSKCIVMVSKLLHFSFRNFGFFVYLTHRFIIST
jgi:hypothetical protein